MAEKKNQETVSVTLTIPKVVYEFFQVTAEFDEDPAHPILKYLSDVVVERVKPFITQEMSEVRVKELLVKLFDLEKYVSHEEIVQNAES